MPRRQHSMTCAICSGVSIRFLGAQLCHPCADAHTRRRNKALSIVNNARLSGKLADPKSFKCADCSDQAYIWEHRDYSKPLDVQPVCYKCNRRRGLAIPPRSHAL
jgi:hypothetical protein